ncbi:CHS5 [[Candida] subhashii]|uniref:Chitin biosynthesis protein CHS5 n=1 Tax=[Candida] subhashii TaxID=561895 RepID=A0A8J5QCX3_9ASCO|nr:CHS5 [[Candida] subhashii]KAG7663914.1 CHS5 [[Candida] subhashii]
MVEVSLTVGKLDASLALLLTKDHHLIEFPTILLPNGVRAGSIVKIKCEQDLESEYKEAEQFQRIQDEILNTFATNLPKPPFLKIRNVTQTSCVLEWDQLDLGTSSLKNLILFKDGKKLGSIPQPLTNKTSKLSGLPIDQSFRFQLRLDTTAGTYLSNEIVVKTLKMTDLSGITVCLGDFTPNDQFTSVDIEETLKNMGANYPAQTEVRVDTTHFLCTRENKQNPEFVKASDMNIPIIRPEWLKACERERRIVGVRDFYVKDCVLPDIFAKNYWQKSSSAAPVVSQPETQQPEQEVSAQEETTRVDAELPPTPKEIEELDNVQEEQVHVEPATVELPPTPKEIEQEDDFQEEQVNLPEDSTEVNDEGIVAVEPEVLEIPVEAEQISEKVESVQEPIPVENPQETQDAIDDAFETVDLNAEEPVVEEAPLEKSEDVPVEETVFGKAETIPQEEVQEVVQDGVEAEPVTSEVVDEATTEPAVIEEPSVKDDEVATEATEGEAPEVNVEEIEGEEDDDENENEAEAREEEQEAVVEPGASPSKKKKNKKKKSNKKK